MSTKITAALLAKGMLPRELPPLFTSVDLGAQSKKLLAVISKSTWTKPDRYSLPKAKFGRRISYVVNPVPYLLLCKHIGANWAAIRSHLKKSKLSAHVPSFFGSDRALKDLDFKNIRHRRIVDSSGHAFVLNTDFARFFPTVYTHSIPWALHTKPVAKAKIKDFTLLGNLLDRQVGHLQEGQTAGIPTGPDASYILAEIVASAIDAEFIALLGERHFGLRYVDDFSLFFANRADAERALACLAQAAREYQIELNPEKTSIASLAEEAAEAWAFALAAFSVSKDVWGQRDSLAKLTELAISLYARHGDGSIGKYAIKKISSAIIANQHIDFAVACILRLSAISPSAFPDVAAFVLSAVGVGYDVDLKPLRRFIETAVLSGVGLGSDMEVCWALWMAYRLKIKLSKTCKSALEASGSPILVIVAKVVSDAGLLQGGVFKPDLASAPPTVDSFERETWLLHYEGSRRGWFGWTDSELKKSSLAPLHAHAVSFLDLAAADPAILVEKKGAPVGAAKLLTLKELQLKFKSKPKVTGYGMHGPPDEDEEDDDDLDY